jgi:hypothetical protein
MKFIPIAAALVCLLIPHRASAEVADASANGFTLKATSI